MTNEMKSLVDKLWNLFAKVGYINQLDAVEQITNLMFIHDLDANDSLRIKESMLYGLPFTSIFSGEIEIGDRKIQGQMLRWSIFSDFDADKMYTVVREYVFPFINKLATIHSDVYIKYLGDAFLKIPTPSILRETVLILDELYSQMEQVKTRNIYGDVYEHILSKIGQTGFDCKFRTPRHITKMIVELMQPNLNTNICDPACGSAGFLISTAEYLAENYGQILSFDSQKKAYYHNRMFSGYDIDTTMLRIGAMNMMTHDIRQPNLGILDSLSTENQDDEKYDLILSNPPFRGIQEARMINTDLLNVCKTSKTELLFISLCLRMLKKGGRCACIVPRSVLYSPTSVYRAIRRELVENNKLEAVISMPNGVFRPYSDARTGILIFTKFDRVGTDNVWFYDMRSDGFTLNDKRAKTKQNDIPDIINRFHNLKNEVSRQRTEQSFLVSKSEIVEKGYDLSMNKYQSTINKSSDYSSTHELLADLYELGIQIDAGLAELETMLC